MEGKTDAKHFESSNADKPVAADSAKPSQSWQRGDPEAGWRVTSNSRKGRGGALLNSEVGGADRVKKRILFNI